MRGRLDHVGIVVADTAAAIRLYESLFGLAADPPLENEPEGVRLTFLRPRGAAAGTTRVELIEPTRADTGVARYLEKRGEGMHHVCFEVEDLVAEIRRLAADGYEVLDRTPRRGMHGERLAFVHPRSARGVLVELYEKGSRQG
ncbi:MAG TPA: methylmalonyl-CoA epimerase [Chloroflexota bacterium]|jgi:methylmalonyl-CoA/ethylmalonyl-CoA epimerase|nr:methylmalonyl-CoA epimerase [Chloroflexota bacterium]